MTSPRIFAACIHGVAEFARDGQVSTRDRRDCFDCEELELLRDLHKEVQRMADECGAFNGPIGDVLDALDSLGRRRLRIRDTTPSPPPTHEGESA